MTRRTSHVWKYFTVVSEFNQAATCNICQQQCSFKSTVSNLNKHLKCKHPGIIKSGQGQTEEIQNRRDSENSRKSNETYVDDGEGSDDVNYDPQNDALASSDDDPAIEFLPIIENKERINKAWVWKYFAKLQNKQALCFLCKNLFSYRTNTSNLRKHLASKHCEEFIKASIEHSPLTPKQSLKQEIESVAIPEHGETEQTNIIIEGPVEDTEVTEDLCTCGADDDEEDTKHRDNCVKATSGMSWDYYKDLEFNNATCKVCDENIVWNSEVQQLRNHLIDNHPDIRFTDKVKVAVIQKSAPKRKRPNPIKTEQRSFRDSNEFRVPQNNFRNHPEGDWETNLDRFGSYVASLMRLLPRERAIRFQGQIIERLIRETSNSF